jgi:hypothetical protein
LRKATISFVMSVCPSARKNWAPTQRVCMKFCIWNFLKNLPRKLAVYSSLTRIKVTSHEDLCTFMINLTKFFLEWEMFQTKIAGKIKTRILCSITFFRKSCRLWDNVKKYGTAGQATDDNTIRRMRFACWITKVTNTHSEYEIPVVFSRQQWLRERASMLRLHVHCLPCYACQTICTRIGAPERVWRTMIKCADACIDSGGGHFERLLWTVTW